MDVLRIALQWIAVCVFLSIAAFVIALPLVCEPPWRLPFRAFNDTFGPLQVDGQYMAPQLNRTRLESQGNMWRPLMFSSTGILGAIEDFVISCWDWYILSMWNGPTLRRFEAFMVGNFFISCACAGPATGTPIFIVGVYKFVFLRFWPERLLTLTQLAVARHCGRRLGVVSREELHEESETELKSEDVHGEVPSPGKFGRAYDAGASSAATLERRAVTMES